MKTILVLIALISFISAKGQHIEWSVVQDEVPVNEFIQITVRYDNLPAGLNPFIDASLTGTFTGEDGKTSLIQGFCDDQRGRIFRIRFMPQVSGDYKYHLTFSTATDEAQFSGAFKAVISTVKGVVEVSSEYPSHFKHRNSDQYYFWNGTTAYWLSGWKDTAIIDESLTRLALYGINRIRVAINGRAHGGSRWFEPTVVESTHFTFKLNPWIAEDPESLDQPNFDVSRMNINHWRILDHILVRARALDMVVSLIFYVDGLDHACDPFKLENMGNKFEKLYYQYAINRFGAYPNVMWDIANEYHLFRTPEWAEEMGAYVKEHDPFEHLISVHGSGDFPFRRSRWADVVMFQSWDECGGFDFITNAISDQEILGFPKPVVNEEYGYEGHYPPWGCGPTAAKEYPDGRSALNRASLAWEIYMAGGYQTTGETAEFGTGAGEDTGGGWINGRGNDKMQMLKYYQIIKNIFESLDFYRLQPAHDLTQYGNYCRAQEGETYLLYSRNPHCRVRLPGNTFFNVQMIDPLTGKKEDLGEINSTTDNNAWQYRKNLSQPAVFILRKVQK